MPLKKGTKKTKATIGSPMQKGFNDLKKDINRLDAKIDSVEKRLDAKIDFSTQSMKEYTDSKFNQVMVRFDIMQNNFDKLNNKLDVSVKGIVEMIVQRTPFGERSFGGQAKIEDQVQDHEKRITILETSV